MQASCGRGFVRRLNVCCIREGGRLALTFGAAITDRIVTTSKPSNITGITTLTTWMWFRPADVATARSMFMVGNPASSIVYVQFRQNGTGDLEFRVTQATAQLIYTSNNTPCGTNGTWYFIAA